jgi:hypothetical protein
VQFATSCGSHSRPLVQRWVPSATAPNPSNFKRSVDILDGNLINESLLAPRARSMPDREQTDGEDGGIVVEFVPSSRRAAVPSWNGTSRDVLQQLPRVSLRVRDCPRNPLATTFSSATLTLTPWVQTLSDRNIERTFSPHSMWPSRH